MGAEVVAVVGGGRWPVGRRRVGGGGGGGGGEAEGDRV